MVNNCLGFCSTVKANFQIEIQSTQPLRQNFRPPWGWHGRPRDGVAVPPNQRMVFLLCYFTVIDPHKYDMVSIDTFIDPHRDTVSIDTGIITSYLHVTTCFFPCSLPQSICHLVEFLPTMYFVAYPDRW